MKKSFKTLQQRFEAGARNHCADLQPEAESSKETQPGLHGKFQSPVSKLTEGGKGEKAEAVRGWW